MNDYLMSKQGIPYQDNFQWRMLLQSKGEDVVSLPVSNSACSKPVPYSPLVEKQS
jgi:hypothetical protein